MAIQKIEVGGQSRNVREESFEAETELWNAYKLANGDRVRVKLVVHKIFRGLDAQGNPEFTADGDPYIVVRHQIQISASSDIGPDAQGEAH